MHQAVGGDFVAFGIIEREMLKHYGLQRDAMLVDVGCGAGRLAAALSDWFASRYVGTDVVPALLAAARRAARRSDWTFVRVRGPRIPVPDASADMVCMFSVITHLLHEDAYRYFVEARRALRPGGRLVFSFIEFRNTDHWRHFARAVDDARERNKRTLTTFLSREAIEVWSRRLNFRIVDIRDGTDRFVPLTESLTLESGVAMDRLGCLGHAIGVLERPEP